MFASSLQPGYLPLSDQRDCANDTVGASNFQLLAEFRHLTLGSSAYIRSTVNCRHTSWRLEEICWYIGTLSAGQYCAYPSGPLSALGHVIIKAEGGQNTCHSESGMQLA